MSPDMVSRFGFVLAAAACGGTSSPAPPAPPAGTVDVAAATDALCVGAGSHAGLPLRLTRTGQTADVPVDLVAPDFVTFDPLTIPAADDEGVLHLYVDTSAPPGTYAVQIDAGDSQASLLLNVGPNAGAPDTSFGKGGLVSLGVGGAVDRAALMAQGNRVLVSAASSDAVVGPSQPVLVRLDEQGAVDHGFALTPKALSSGVFALGARDDGTILAATNDPAGCVSFSEIAPNGAVGFSAKTGPCNSTAPASATTMAMCVVEQPDQSVLVAGSIEDCCGFASRFDAFGVHDAAYAASTPKYLNSVWACGLAPNGDLVLASYTGMVRLAPDGAPVYDTDVANGAPNASALAFLHDGTTVVGDWAPTEIRWMTADGTTTRTRAVGAAPLALVTTADDALLVLMPASLVRLQSDGSEDASFTAASVVTPWSSAQLPPASVVTDACGRIVVATPGPDSVEVRRFWP